MPRCKPRTTTRLANAASANSTAHKKPRAGDGAAGLGGMHQQDGGHHQREPRHAPERRAQEALLTAQQQLEAGWPLGDVTRLAHGAGHARHAAFSTIQVHRAGKEKPA